MYCLVSLKNIPSVGGSLSITICHINSLQNQIHCSLTPRLRPCCFSHLASHFLLVIQSLQMSSQLPPLLANILALRTLRGLVDRHVAVDMRDEIVAPLLG